MIMVDSPNYYQVLQLERRATLTEIRQAFHRLARQYHPDLHPDDPHAETQFKQICEAYEVLSDPARRQQYDQQHDQRYGQGVTSASPNISAKAAASDRNPVHRRYRQCLDKVADQDYQRALHDLNQLIEDAPDFVDAYLTRFQVRYELRDDRGILSDFHQLKQVAPNQAEAYYYLGLARYRLGYTQFAIEAYSQAIVHHRQYAQAYYRRGLAHQDLQEDEEAILDFQAAVTLFNTQKNQLNSDLAQVALNTLRSKAAKSSAQTSSTQSHRHRSAARPSAPPAVITNHFLQLLYNTWQTTNRYLLNPGGGLLPAYARLTSTQARCVSLLLAAIACVSFALSVCIGSSFSWIMLLMLYLVSSGTFLILVALNGLIRLTTRSRINSTVDVFIAGTTLLPIGLLAPLAAIAAQFDFTLFLVIAVFAACLVILTLYHGYTQILNLTEQTATLTVPIILLLSGWGATWLSHLLLG